MPKTGTKLLHTDAPVILAFTPAEAAAALRISKTRLYALLRTSELASYRVGRSRRISLRAIEAYQQRLEEAEQGIRQEGGRSA
jgi:excisionase family DNA binding protein